MNTLVQAQVRAWEGSPVGTVPLHKWRDWTLDPPALRYYLVGLEACLRFQSPEDGDGDPWRKLAC